MTPTSRVSIQPTGSGLTLFRGRVWCTLITPLEIET